MTLSLALTTLAATVFATALIVALGPLLRRYALARPNARSSHETPTPQGGGIAVLGGAVLAIAGAGLLIGVDVWSLAPALAAAAVLAVVGAVDDIRLLPAGPRLALQAVAATAVVLATGRDVRIVPALPQAVETAALVLAAIWFVNLVNFMDGIDWMSVAELVPVTAMLAFLSAVGGLPEMSFLAAALLGGLLGFAPLNKPVARLFLGDVGSLPLGLLVGWMLLRVAGTGAWAAALILPLYYLADTTLTLLRRLLRGERVWEAHREHFYQQALANGFSVPEVVARVFGLNLALAALAGSTLLRPSTAFGVAALAVGAVLVALTLRRFATTRGASILAGAASRSSAR